MHDIYISIGSNINRSTNIRSSIEALKTIFKTLVISPVYETTAVGFDGQPFYNLVVSTKTLLSADETHQCLTKIENQHQRDRTQAKFSSRTLDLDLLLYDNLIIQTKALQIPRDEIIKYAFVLAPLADIAPELKHPVYDQSYQQLWDEFDGSSQQIKLINFGLPTLDELIK
ncbi:MAG: 2-amino-4-hydroxy-6-hydroxymethyldihydropteridine diphosphokinase [Methylococcales bacterium]|jgi:2-amino-4-hydroxy-6-hydroxymethyldihydropteridine diphosphokinase|nr:2-amino-4-hydroxy-6-hydroxymethyldihydropteridine diphosphokinase [Methylococcales bacterium]